jgi:hypothetical protein
VVLGSGSPSFPMNLPPGHVYRIPRQGSGRRKGLLGKIGGCFGC